MPIVLRVTIVLPPMLPSVMPTVSHESNSQFCEPATLNRAGLTPPMFAPNGWTDWNAAGRDSGDVGDPNTAYTFLAPSNKVTARRYVVYPAILRV